MPTKALKKSLFISAKIGATACEEAELTHFGEKKRLATIIKAIFSKYLIQIIKCPIYFPSKQSYGISKV